MKIQKFNLDEPIFQLKLNGMTRSRAEKNAAILMDRYVDSGMQIVFLFSDITNMECIWKGYKYEQLYSERIETFLSKLHTTLEEMSLNINYDTTPILSLLRELKLKEIEKC